jgi:hypothetical protein
LTCIARSALCFEREKPTIIGIINVFIVEHARRAVMAKEPPSALAEC